MTTKCTFYENGYQIEDEAVIESAHRDDRGPYIVMNQTLFYPQGGGQPSDTGLVLCDHRTIPVLFVRMVDGEIRHYMDQDYSPALGQKAFCRIDPEKRMLHTKLHTSGHLIGNILENLYPSYRAVKGHHFPGECYVEFCSKGAFENIDLDLLKQKIHAHIVQDEPVEALFVTDEQFSAMCSGMTYTIPTTRTQSIRLVRIGNFPFQPCRGLHVKSIGELQGLNIIKIKAKNDRIKVYYCMEDKDENIQSHQL